MHFIIVGRDGSDSDALARRTLARPAHLENMSRLHRLGSVLEAGALLGPADVAIGSVVLVEFDDRPAVDLWLASEPYVTEGVWREIEILPIRRLEWGGGASSFFSSPST